MKLFPHNREAIKNTERIFKTENRACIIHPMGTGKAVIIAQFISDHPRASHLLLAPGDHIFDEVTKHAKAASRLQCQTYAAALDLRDLREYQNFDYIYIDEFHRPGSKKWEYAVNQILAANLRAKVLGTSATPVRHLDNARNMAFELFNNNVASYISYGHAFVEGILRVPKYITAIYTIDQEYNRLAKKIKASAGTNRKLLASHLRRKVLDWRKTSGIDVVLKKHLPNSRKRIVVFCNNFDEMALAESILGPTLKEIFGEILLLHVHSRLSPAANKAAMSEFRSKDKNVKVLFSVNKVNEGLHGKDISVAILMRRTDSANVYYQQIGRCFSVGQQDQPIIFDFVNNFDNLRAYGFKAHVEKDAVSYINSRKNLNAGGIHLRDDTPLIEIIDESQDIRNIFEKIESDIDPFEVRYCEAKAYFEKYGHLYVTTKQNAGLYFWIAGMRQNNRLNKVPPHRVARLDALKMDWERSIKGSWIETFNKLREHMSKGEAQLKKNKDLRSWVWTQRQRFTKGKLSTAQRNLLASVIDLESAHDQLWKRHLALLQSHKEVHDNFNVSTKDPLYQTIYFFRKQLRNKTVPKEYIKELKKLNFKVPKEKRERRSFDYRREQLVKFITKHGRLPGFQESEGKTLAGWVSIIRKKMKNDELTEEQIRSLEPLGVFDAVSGAKIHLNRLSQYFENHSNFPPASDKKQYNNVRKSVIRLKTLHQRGELSQEHYRAIERLPASILTMIKP